MHDRGYLLVSSATARQGASGGRKRFCSWKQRWQQCLWRLMPGAFEECCSRSFIEVYLIVRVVLVNKYVYVCMSVSQWQSDIVDDMYAHISTTQAPLKNTGSTYLHMQPHSRAISNTIQSPLEGAIKKLFNKCLPNTKTVTNIKILYSMNKILMIITVSTWWL